MEAIWILLLLFVLIMLAGVYAAVRAVRAAKRGIDRTVHQARRTVEETRLRARQLAQPGAAGELAQLRLSLRGSMRATGQALQAAAPQDQSLSESLILFQRLSAHAQDLEADLKRLEQEPDKSRLAALLPDLRQRTERITHSADSLRWAVQERTQRFAHDDLDSLNREIEMEAGALRHWTAVEPEEPRTDVGAWPPPDAGARPETGSRPEAGARPGTGARSGPEAVREPEPPRPSLGAGPQTEPQDWQKPWQQQSRRPENTA
ncbi:MULTISPECIES: hypothetical protein [Streptomyces violaceusniger group]|uniref:Secreted protein n=2 Tax=Streptomyces violaceusniger group TaxID=2839105 RepID=A0ABD5JMU9_9ACTN|nr:hypothetical protein [Streptomyces violaceusniger]KUL46318.1 hypothetical protein ADL28_35615 [Streptomyces violaceusniger]MEE4589793.1 hypothetical protein [Streptomyces sp. DSM 41602]